MAIVAVSIGSRTMPILRVHERQTLKNDGAAGGAGNSNSRRVYFFLIIYRLTIACIRESLGWIFDSPYIYDIENCIFAYRFNNYRVYRRHSDGYFLFPVDL